MKLATIKIKHDIGETIEWSNGKLRVIGFSYVKGRGVQYILLSHTGSKFEWEYLYDFEIKMLGN